MFNWLSCELDCCILLKYYAILINRDNVTEKNIQSPILNFVIKAPTLACFLPFYFIFMFDLWSGSGVVGSPDLKVMDSTRDIGLLNYNQET